MSWIRPDRPRRTRSVLAALPVAVLLAAPLFVAPLAAQTPGVGDRAPDFALPGATKGGPTGTSVRLADLRGQTVVLAFFFKARTSGCTHQMETYRDRYASLFHGGKGVTVIAISTDADTTLANWAREEGLPFLLASDVGGAAGKAYGTFDAASGLDARTLFIVGPDGTITYRAQPFRELVEGAYTELGGAVDRSTKSR
jgi:peroxiredoxin Q/BCP